MNRKYLYKSPRKSYITLEFTHGFNPQISNHMMGDMTQMIQGEDQTEMLNSLLIVFTTKIDSKHQFQCNLSSTS